jgi:hypothetical protein
MIVPFFALVLASAIGAWTLRILWMREVTLAQRRGCATTLALLAVAAGSLLWWLAPDENWRPACVALVLTVVVLHRPLVFALSETQQRIRAGWVLVLAIGLTVLTVLETTAPALRARGVVLAGGGLMLLATSLFGTVLAARNDLRAVHAKD